VGEVTRANRAIKVGRLWPIAATQARAQLMRQWRPWRDALDSSWPGPSGGHRRRLAETSRAGRHPIDAVPEPVTRHGDNGVRQGLTR
jgi:hypothetical protein